ncbi:hypothetical protein BGZ49_009158 [Haplosporangium sp. Z 27]|nr:hypothetical protein BGZ49_009158 [Haplosporangium sp. Z 27]
MRGIISGSQKTCQWKNSLNQSRRGVEYFLDQEDVVLATPKGYYQHQSMTTENKQAIIEEWCNWMNTFRESDHNALRELAKKPHSPENDAIEYLTTKA